MQEERQAVKDELEQTRLTARREGACQMRALAAELSTLEQLCARQQKAPAPQPASSGHHGARSATGGHGERRTPGPRR